MNSSYTKEISKVNKLLELQNLLRSTDQHLFIVRNSSVENPKLGVILGDINQVHWNDLRIFIERKTLNKKHGVFINGNSKSLAPYVKKDVFLPGYNSYTVLGNFFILEESNLLSNIELIVANVSDTSIDSAYLFIPNDYYEDFLIKMTQLNWDFSETYMKFSFSNLLNLLTRNIGSISILIIFICLLFNYYLSVFLFNKQKKSLMFTSYVYGMNNFHLLKRQMKVLLLRLLLFIPVSIVAVYLNFSIESQVIFGNYYLLLFLIIFLIVSIGEFISFLINISNLRKEYS